MYYKCIPKIGGNTMKKNFCLISSFLLVFLIITEFFPNYADAYYTGRTPSSSTIQYKFGSIEEKYKTTWRSAVNTWNNDQNRNTFSYNANATNILSIELDRTRPNLFGRLVYRGASNRTTPFTSYLNTERSDIRNSSTVRRSTASHEMGHALGLDHNSQHSIMNSSRNRTSVFSATALDKRNVNNR